MKLNKVNNHFANIIQEIKILINKQKMLTNSSVNSSKCQNNAVIKLNTSCLKCFSARLLGYFGTTVINDTCTGVNS